MEIAILVYKELRKARRKDSSFDNMSNIGISILKGRLEEAGISVSYCSVDSASKYDIILVSFTSNYDILAYYKQVHGNKIWEKRNFKVLGGGFGMQNPIPIINYIDYAWFGRCENEIVTLIENNLDYNHPSFMDMKNMTPVSLNQSEIIPETVDVGNSQYTETIMGCPNKCYYCHYSFARKYVSTGKHYNLSMYSSSQELDMFNIEEYDCKKAKITAGLDGYSERIRRGLNRKTTNEEVKYFIEQLSSRAQIKGKAVFLKLYNIVGHEIEGDDDYCEFVELLHTLQLKKRLVVIVHSTPLHPSPLTPVAYSKINLNVDTRKYNGSPIIDTEKINAFHSPYQESAWGLFESLVVERATHETQQIFHDVVFNKKLAKLKAKDKVRAIRNKYDVSSLIREYRTTEKLPTWFLNGYIDQDKIRGMRIKMLNLTNCNTAKEQ